MRSSLILFALPKLGVNVNTSYLLTRFFAFTTASGGRAMAWRAD